MKKLFGVLILLVMLYNSVGSALLISPNADKQMLENQLRNAGIKIQGYRQKICHWPESNTPVFPGYFLTSLTHQNKGSVNYFTAAMLADFNCVYNSIANKAFFPLNALDLMQLFQKRQVKQLKYCPAIANPYAADRAMQRWDLNNPIIFFTLIRSHLYVHIYNLPEIIANTPENTQLEWALKNNPVVMAYIENQLNGEPAHFIELTHNVSLNNVWASLIYESSEDESESHFIQHPPVMSPAQHPLPLQQQGVYMEMLNALNDPAIITFAMIVILYLVFGN